MQNATDKISAAVWDEDVHLRRLRGDNLRVERVLAEVDHAAISLVNRHSRHFHHHLTHQHTGCVHLKLLLLLLLFFLKTQNKHFDNHTHEYLKFRISRLTIYAPKHQLKHSQPTPIKS